MKKQERLNDPSITRQIRSQILKHLQSKQQQQSPSPNQQQQLQQQSPKQQKFKNNNKNDHNSDYEVNNEHQQQQHNTSSTIFKFSGPMSCRMLSDALGCKANDLHHFLPLDNYTLEDMLTTDMILNLCSDLGIQAKLELNLAELDKFDDASYPIVEPIDNVNGEKGATRKSPVVTIMGHVDHGKTTLLDTLRKTNVAEREAGGITQHIGAFKVKLPGILSSNGGNDSDDTLTFIDTPGHEAFTRMRNAGAKVTDIIVLVIAADDGVMPQTVEVIKHAKNYGVPIIVAINKIDRDNANPERVEDQLLDYDIVTEKNGGNVQVVGISALKGLNIDQLLEAIALQAEMLDLKAKRKNCPMEATVIEGRVDKGLGLTTTAIVRRGTMRPGQFFVAGLTYGRVKSIRDQNLKQLKEGYPSDPVEIIGFNGMPEAGDFILEVQDEIHAKRMIDYRLLERKFEQEEEEAMKLFEQKLELAALKEEALKKRQDKFIHGTELTAEEELSEIEDEIEEAFTDKRPTLPLIIKADVRGALDAFHNIISSFPSDEVRIQIVKESVGQISDSDIELAKATGSQIIGMNIKASSALALKAQNLKIPLVHFKVIYHLIDYLKGELTKILPLIEQEEVIGEFEFKQSFEISMKTDSGKTFKQHVVGGLVTDGVVKSDATFFRVMRFNKLFMDNCKLVSLQLFKEKVKEVKKGSECAIALEGYDEAKKGDKIQAVVRRQVARTFEDLIKQKEQASKHYKSKSKK